MADFANITARATLNAQAVATMGVDSNWDARVTEYVRWSVLQNAECEYGSYADAENDRQLKVYDLKSKHGEAWQHIPSLRASIEPLARKADELRKRWEETCLEPSWLAAIELVKTPAPTLAAAVFKAAVAEIDEVWNDVRMDRNCIEVLTEDFDRLAGQSAARRLWDDLIQRFEVVEAKPIEEATDDSIKEAGELIEAIMAMPAPDAAAARWKLDYVLNAEGSTTASWSADFIAQVQADYRHLLGGA